VSQVKTVDMNRTHMAMIEHGESSEANAMLLIPNTCYIIQARNIWSSNSCRRSDYLDSNGAPDNLMNSLEGGHERIPLNDTRENDEASSVPLLIVGNKVDKLSASGKLTIQAACAQQVFVVRHLLKIVHLVISK
jgi:hypothetical protein